MENHPFQIIWGEPAKQDFEKIITQIAEAAPMTAARFGEDMLRAVETLGWSPYRCPNLYETPECRYLLFKNYRIVFKVNERANNIGIVAILFPYQQFDLLRLN